MAIFQHGKSTEQNFRDWIERTRLRFPHARATISAATDFDPMERYLLQRTINAQGLSNRVRIEDVGGRGPVIRVGSRTMPLSREGVGEAVDYLKRTGLRDYWEWGPDTPKALTFNASRAYQTQITDIVQPALAARYQDQGLTVSRESVRPRSFDTFRELYLDPDSNQITGIFRHAPDSGMQVIRASVLDPSRSSGRRYLTERELLGALGEDSNRFYKFGDLTGDKMDKLAKRLGPAMFNESHFSATLDRKLNAGVINAQSFFDALSQAKAGTDGLTPNKARNKLLANSDILRKRAVDGALVMNESLLDDAVKAYQGRITELQDIINDVSKGGLNYDRAIIESLKDQQRHIFKNIKEIEKIANQGGRFQNFRAMGFDLEQLGTFGDERLKDLSESMAKGDIIVFGRNKPRGQTETTYEIFARTIAQLNEIINPGSPVPDFRSMDLLGFADVGGDKGGNLAFVTEVGLGGGGKGSYFQFDPTHVLPGVRTNVENITGANILFRGRLGELNIGDSMASHYQQILDDALRTGSLPVGYIRNMVDVLKRQEQELIGAGKESELLRVRSAKARASRLLERAATGTTLDDPALIREFATTMRESITRAGGKLDPLLEMPNSIFAHVAPDTVSMVRRAPGQTALESIQGMHERVAADHIAFDPQRGFVMNSITAAKAYHAHGGFDWDDSLEAHLRWSTNKAGDIQLYSLTDRMPMSLGEGGVYKVWGFQKDQPVSDVLDFLEAATGTRDVNTATTEAAKRELREIRFLQNQSARYQRVRASGGDDLEKTNRVLGRIHDQTSNRLNRIWRGQGTTPSDRIRALGFADIDAALGGFDVNVSIGNYIQRHIHQQTDFQDNAIKNGYEWARDIFDRRVGNQVRQLDATDGLRMAWEAAAAEGSSVSDRTELLGQLADRGVLNSVKGYGEIYDESGELVADTLKAIAADDDFFKDILDNRILKYDTMASYEHWLKTYTERGNKTADLFHNINNEIFEGSLSKSEKAAFESLLKDYSSASVGSERAFVADMLRQFKTETGNPGLLGRSVNVNAIIDSMNSNLIAMESRGLLTKKQISQIAASAPYVDTERLIDLMVQGGLDDDVVRRVNQIYYGQVAGVATMMRGMETMFDEIFADPVTARIAEGQKITRENITEEFGLSRELFGQRLGKSLFRRNSEAGQVFFSAFADAYGTVDPVSGKFIQPETMKEFENMVGGTRVFGTDEFARQRKVAEQVRQHIGMFEDDALKGAYKTIPELVPEIFTQQEVEAAEYLQNVYRTSYDNAFELLTRMDTEEVNKVLEFSNIIAPGSSIDDLATEIASGNVVGAFADNFAQYDEVTDAAGNVVRQMNDDSWRVLGALIQTGQNNRLTKSSTFSTLMGGTQAFFTKRRVKDTYGEGVDLLDYFGRRFDDLGEEQQRRLMEVAEAEFPIGMEGRNTSRDALEAFQRRLAETMESNLGQSEEELRGKVRGGLMFDHPRFDAPTSVKEKLTQFADNVHESIYRRANKETITTLMDNSMFRRGVYGTAGLIAFSFLYQRNQKTEEQMMGDSLPGGGSYKTPIPTSQIELSNQYVPQSSSGVTYNVNVSGGDPQLRDSLEALLGMTSAGSTYESRPQHAGSRAQFREIESSFR